MARAMMCSTLQADARSWPAFHERAPDLVMVGSFRDATWDALEVAREIRKTVRMLPVMDSIHQPPARREEDICVISPS